MNITQSTNKSRPSVKRAAIGGGVITTPAVATHIRRNAPNADLHAPQSQAVHKQALVGGGVITTLAVAAHIRRTMATPHQR